MNIRSIYNLKKKRYKQVKVSRAYLFQTTHKSLKPAAKHDDDKDNNNKNKIKKKNIR